MIEQRTLRVMAAGQFVFSLIAIGYFGVVRLVMPQLTILEIILSIVPAMLGAGVAWVLSSREYNLHAILSFVAGAIITVELALIIAGAGYGAYVVFCWPIAATALLLGGRSGIVVGVICSVLLASTYFAQHSGLMTPLLDSTTAQIAGILDAMLAFTLVVATINTAVSRSLNSKRSVQEAYKRIADSQSEADQTNQGYLDSISLITIAEAVATEQADVAEAISSNIATASTQLKADVSNNDKVQMLVEQMEAQLEQLRPHLANEQAATLAELIRQNVMLVRKTSSSKSVNVAALLQTVDNTVQLTQRAQKLSVSQVQLTKQIEAVLSSSNNSLNLPEPVSLSEGANITATVQSA